MGQSGRSPPGFRRVVPVPDGRLTCTTNPSGYQNPVCEKISVVAAAAAVPAARLAVVAGEAVEYASSKAAEDALKTMRVGVPATARAYVRERLHLGALQAARARHVVLARRVAPKNVSVCTFCVVMSSKPL